MRKSHLFVIAGAAVILSGCPKVDITSNKPLIPPPQNDPMTQEMGPGINTEVTQAPVTAEAPVFEPLTDAVPSGGVDVAPKKSSKKAAKAIKAGGKYTVKSGDTPERIARKLRVRLSALMEANNLDQQSARRLQIGQKLVIPGKGAVVSKTVKKSAAKKVDTAAAPVAAADADGKYTVKSGDTPERIARKLRVRLSELLKANNLDQQSARRLQIGQKLVIPGKAAPIQNVTNDVQPPVVENTTVQPPVVEDTVVQPAAADATAVQPTTAPVEATAVQPVATADADSEIQLIEIEEDTTVAVLSAKLNVSADVLSQKNSGKTEFKKGELIFVPKK